MRRLTVLCDRIAVVKLALISFRFMIRCRLRRVRTHGIVTCSGTVPRLVAGGRIELGERCAFRNERVASLIGAEDGAQLSIGARTFVNEGATIVAAERIEIGADCRIGEFAAIFDTDYHAVSPAREAKVERVTIGDNVWIARGALVLPGVSIGANSVVAAHSVVRADVAPNVVVAGNPAKVVATFESPEGWRRA